MFSTSSAFSILPDSSVKLVPAQLYHTTLALFYAPQVILSLEVPCGLVGSSREVFHRDPHEGPAWLFWSPFQRFCPLSSHMPRVPASDLKGLKIRGLVSDTSLPTADNFSSFPIYHATAGWDLFF